MTDIDVFAVSDLQPARRLPAPCRNDQAGDHIRAFGGTELQKRQGFYISDLSTAHVQALFAF